METKGYGRRSIYRFIDLLIFNRNISLFLKSISLTDNFGDKQVE